ncbi:MAG: phage terminase large subunit family protein [Proteobacteria bacterium]|nr:phage terminase large subunit family protein [Pseudomonadota bacterium]MBU1611822.1 phage terminase large subunit family protein [Pseudomonadota bacterium]
MDEAVAMLEPPFRFSDSERAVFAKPPTFRTFDWARKNMRIVAGPYKNQLFRPDIAPYAEWIMDIFDLPHVREVYIIGPSQITKTSIGYACLLAEMDREVDTMGLCMPEEKGLNRMMEERLTKHVKASKSLRDKVSKDRHAFRVDEIRFQGGTLFGMWSGSESRVRSHTMRVLIGDEPDAYDSKGTLALLRERLTIYEEMEVSKFLVMGKVRGTEQESETWQEAKARGQVWYNIEARCPVCHEYQVMDDRRIKPLEDTRDHKEIRRLELGRYECEHCGYQWNDSVRNLAIRAGRLKADKEVERPTVVVFQIRSWESLLISLSKVLADWFEAQEHMDPVKLRNYDNNHKAVPFKVITRETQESTVRKMILRDHEPRTVPPEAWALTCGIDMQLTGFWFVVRAWAKSMESWLVDWNWLNTWDDVSVLLDATYPVAGMEGVVAPIWRAGIDIGGTRKDGRDEGVTMTEEAKAFLQDNWWRGNVFGTKGSARDMPVSVRMTQVGRAPDIGSKVQAAIGKLTVYLIDTKSMKDRIHVRLHPESKMPMWLFAEERKDSLAPYIKQLLAEQKKMNEKGKEVWDAGRRANHLLDCEVINSACADPLWTPSLRMLPEPVFIYPETSVQRETRSSSEERRRW